MITKCCDNTEGNEQSNYHQHKNTKWVEEFQLVTKQ